MNRRGKYMALTFMRRLTWGGGCDARQKGLVNGLFRKARVGVLVSANSISLTLVRSQLEAS